MKNKQTIIAGVTLGLGLLATHSAEAINLNFGNIPGAQINFVGTGDDFFFSPSSGNQFMITGSDGVGDSIGDFGSTSGTFHIGAITINGGFQSAPVTGSGVLKISDGVKVLTGTVVWNEIQTQGTQGSLNLLGVLNLSSLSYSGSQSDLKTLALPGVGTEAVAFTFIPAKTLTQLTQNGRTFQTSFSGTLTSTTTPDAGASLLLLGSSMTGLVLMRRNRKSGC